MILIVVKHPVRPQYAITGLGPRCKSSPRPHGLSQATSASTGSEVSKTRPAARSRNASTKPRSTDEVT